MTKKKAATTTTPAIIHNPSRFIGGKVEERYPTICTPEEMADAIRRAHGVAAVAAKMLDCTRRTVLSYINRYPEVKLAYNEAREENVDVAENKLLEKLKAGERWAIESWLFYSKEGRARGWLKRAEQAQDLNLLNAIQIIIPDNARDGGEAVAAEATVDVTQIGDDGNVRQYTYATTLEEARHQKNIAGLVRGGGKPMVDADATAWLNIDAAEGEEA